MSIKIASLIITLGANSAQLEKDLNKAKKKAEGWGVDVEKISAGVATAFKATAAGVTTAGAAMAALYGFTAPAIDAHGKLAAVLGTTTENLEAMKIAADLGGVKAASMNTAMLKFVTTLGDAERGTGEALKVFDELNLSAARLSEMDTSDALAVVIKRLQEVPDAATRASYGMKLFEQAGLAMLNINPDQIRVTADEMARLGLSMTQLDYSKVAQSQDSLTKLGSIATGVRNKLTVGIAEVISTVSDNLYDAALNSDTFAASLDEMINKAQIGLGYFLEYTGKTLALIAANPAVAGSGLIGYILFGPLGAAAIGGIVATIKGISEHSTNAVAGIVEEFNVVGDEAATMMSSVGTSAVIEYKNALRALNNLKEEQAKVSEPANAADDIAMRFVDASKKAADYLIPWYKTLDERIASTTERIATLKTELEDLDIPAEVISGLADKYVAALSVSPDITVNLIPGPIATQDPVDVKANLILGPITEQPSIDVQANLIPEPIAKQLSVDVRANLIPEPIAKQLSVDVRANLLPAPLAIQAPVDVQANLLPAPLAIQAPVDVQANLIPAPLATQAPVDVPVNLMIAPGQLEKMGAELGAISSEPHFINIASRVENQDRVRAEIEDYWIYNPIEIQLAAETKKLEGSDLIKSSFIDGVKQKVQGASDAVSDVLSGIGAKLDTGFTDTVSGFIESMQDRLGGFVQSIQDTAKQAGAAVVAQVHAVLAELADAVSAGSDGIALGAEQFYGGLFAGLTNYIAGLREGLADEAQGAVQLVHRLISEIQGAVSTLDPQGGVLTGAFSGIGPAMNEIATQARTAATTAAGVFSGIGPIIDEIAAQARTAATTVSELADEVVGQIAQIGAQADLSGMTGAFATAGNTIGIAFGRVMEGMVKTADAATADMAGSMTTATGQMTETVDGFSVSLVDRIRGAAETVADTLGGLFGAVNQKAETASNSLVSGAAGWLAAMALEVTGFGDAVSEHTKKLETAQATIDENVASNSRSLIQIVKDFDVVGALKTITQSIINFDGFDTAAGIISKGMKLLASALRPTPIVVALADYGAKIFDAITTVKDLLDPKKLIAQIVDAGTAITQAISNIELPRVKIEVEVDNKDAIESIGELVSTGMSQATGLGNVQIPVVNALVNEIPAAADIAQAALNGVNLDDAVNNIPKQVSEIKTFMTDLGFSGAGVGLLTDAYKTLGDEADDLHGKRVENEQILQNLIVGTITEFGRSAGVADQFADATAKIAAPMSDAELALVAINKQLETAEGAAERVFLTAAKAGIQLRINAENDAQTALGGTDGVTGAGSGGPIITEAEDMSEALRLAAIAQQDLDDQKFASAMKLNEANDLEMEALQVHRDELELQAGMAYARKLDAERQNKAQLLDILKIHSRQVEAFEKASFLTRARMSLSWAKQSLDTLGEHSKKMFKISQAVGIAEAGVSMYQGIAAAWKMGWPAGILPAAMVALQGAAAIKSIREQKIGGSTSTASTATGSSASLSTPSVSSLPVASESVATTESENAGMNLMVNIFSADELIDKTKYKGLLLTALDEIIESEELDIKEEIDKFKLEVNAI